MAERGIEAEWADLMRDLQRLQETHLRLQGKHFVVRSRTQGVVAQVVRCVGARLPPTDSSGADGLQLAGDPACRAVWPRKGGECRVDGCQSIPIDRLPAALEV